MKNKNILFYILLIIPAALLDIFSTVRIGMAHGSFYSFSDYNLPILIFVLLVFTVIFTVFLIWMGRKKRITEPPEIAFLLLLVYIQQILFPLQVYSLTPYDAEYSRLLFLYNTLIQTDHYTQGWVDILFGILIFPFIYAALLGICNLIITVFQKKLLEKSLIYRLVSLLGKNQSLSRKITLTILGTGVLSLVITIPVIHLILLIENIETAQTSLWLFLLIPAGTEFLLLLFLFSGKKSIGKDMETISLMISQTASGALIEENPLESCSPLYQTGEELITLGKIIDENIKKGIASERLKVELITNVSHDLRTPLTSIIGYCQILEEQELPPSATEYAHKLMHKARYLNEMVEDVFDLSKAASSHIKLNITPIDMHRLIEQTFGEMIEKIEASGFMFKKQFKARHTLILADGMRMHRVIQNLIDNALKYALKGSRIYFLTENNGNAITFTILNTASYDMDFGDKDLTERFTRGDSARSGEGSGLGLAIAKTFTEACGGAFGIQINGDQFAAILTFPVTERKLKETDR